MNQHQGEAAAAIRAAFGQVSAEGLPTGATARIGAMTVWVWRRVVSQDWSAEIQLESDLGNSAIRIYGGTDASDALRKLDARRGQEAELHRSKAAALDRVGWSTLPVGAAENGGES